MVNYELFLPFEKKGLANRVKCSNVQNIPALYALIRINQPLTKGNENETEPKPLSLTC